MDNKENDAKISGSLLAILPVVMNHLLCYALSEPKYFNGESLLKGDKPWQTWNAHPYPFRLSLRTASFLSERMTDLSSALIPSWSVSLRSSALKHWSGISRTSAKSHRLEENIRPKVKWRKSAQKAVLQGFLSVLISWTFLHWYFQ